MCPGFIACDPLCPQMSAADPTDNKDAKAKPTPKLHAGKSASELLAAATGGSAAAPKKSPTKVDDLAAKGLSLRSNGEQLTHTHHVPLPPALC